MKQLMEAVQQINAQRQDVPFALYAPRKVQHLLNVPVSNPLLVAVLTGEKILGNKEELVCKAGDFVFLSDNPAIDMRNIPKGNGYYSLIIEFDALDFADLPNSKKSGKVRCTGKISKTLETCLQQFIEWTSASPKSLWALRRKEILHLLYQEGFMDIPALGASGRVSQQLRAIYSREPAVPVPMSVICREVAMSESTVRRKLHEEGTTVQAIRDQVRLGQGLHLLQTTSCSIGLIAQQCGYQSQSRFGERFRERFGMTPTALRRTLLTDQGETLTV